MKIKWMFVYLLALLAASANAQVTQQWAARYSTNRDSSARAIAVDSIDGQVYVTGVSGNGTAAQGIYLTIAYDFAGNRLWAASYDSPAGGENYAHAIALDASTGNVYVTGESDGIGTASDFATVAYDSAGNQLWVARYDGPAHAYDRAYAIAVDAGTGNVYVTGASQDAGNEYAIIAYDSGGNQLWVSRYHGPAHGGDEPSAIAVDDRNGNVYVTGSSWGPSTLDYSTVAYDSNGAQLWTARYHGAGNGFAQATSIAVDPGTGNVYVTGHSDEGPSGIDYATLAYDSSGNQLWVARYNGPGNGLDIPQGVVANTVTGQVCVTGMSDGGPSGLDYATVAYDGSGAQLWVARYNGPGNSADSANAIALDQVTGNVYVTGASVGLGSFDYATVAYDSSGNQLWVARYSGPGPNFHIATAIAADETTGNVFVTGQSMGLSGFLDYATIMYSQP